MILHQGLSAALSKNMLAHIKQLHRVWTTPGNRHNRLRAVFRAVSWFITKRTSNTPIISVFGDRRFICHTDGFVANSIMLFSEWAEYDSLKFLDSYLRPGDSFLDVGANVGIFTLLASRHVGSGRLVCIEPGRLQRERLQAHLSLNNIAADVFSYAVSNEEKTISFSTGDAVAHISAATEDTGAKSEEVNARRMDSFIPHQQYQLMKIDVEGFELAALQGASQLIADGHLPVILLELNGSSERYGIPSSEIIALLRKAGYTLGIYRHDQKHFDTTAHLWDDVLAVNEKGLALLKERIADLKIIG